MFSSPCSVVVRAAKLMDTDYRCGPGMSATHTLCTSSLAELLHLALSRLYCSFTNQNSPQHEDTNLGLNSVGLWLLTVCVALGLCSGSHLCSERSVSAGHILQC